jgi:demethylmenaquinone methyltransferase/2-methoxy-6-polyprenyl-1,4-benzoquinol methylase
VKLARRKGVQRTLQADAMDLPLAGQSFDAVTIGFGLRNLPDWPAALREMRRVLISNGHLLVLDFSLPDHVGLRWLYRAYLHRILPRLSRLITGYADAYEYLAASIENFPRAAAMCELIESNGFQNTVASHISGGIVSIYTAEKL